MPHRNGSGTRTEESPVTPVTLEAFLYGQRVINGKLCYVDQHLVKAITELRNAVDGVLKVDLRLVDEALAKAKSYSEAIPGVNPPGCEYPN